MAEVLRKFSLVTWTVSGTKLDYYSSGCGSKGCGICKGICETDQQCEGVSSCFVRDHNEPVPGCEEGGFGDVDGYDYCAVLPRGINFGLLGCYKDNTGKSFGTGNTDIKKKGGKFYPLLQCKQMCKDACYMGIERDKNGNLKCFCSDDPEMELSGKGVGLFECDNHEKVSVECTVDSTSVFQFGCGGDERMSVFVNVDKEKDKCNSQLQWILPASKREKTKLCTEKRKYTLPPATAKILHKFEDSKMTKKNLEDQCAKWCEMDFHCGCHGVKQSKCFLIKSEHCAEVANGNDHVKVCNNDPPAFQLAGCYSTQDAASAFGKHKVLSKVDLDECKKVCRDTCYMAIGHEKKCFCFDALSGVEKKESQKCGPQDLSVGGCSVVGGCGGAKTFSVYVNSLGGGKCIGELPSAKVCDPAQSRRIKGYSYKILKSVKSGAACARVCQMDSMCGSFSFYPDRGCALLPTGLPRTRVALESTVPAAEKPKYVAGECVQYVTKLLNEERLPNPFDFQMVGCYPEKKGTLTLYDGELKIVSGLEACKMLCHNSCYMGFNGKNNCFCSSAPRWTGGKEGSVPLLNTEAGCSNEECSVKHGCGGGTSTKRMFSVYSNLFSTCAETAPGGSAPWAVKDMPPSKQSKTCGVVEGIEVKGDLISKKSTDNAEECRYECESGLESWRCQCFSYSSTTKSCKLMGIPGANNKACKWGPAAVQTTSGKCDSLPLSFVLQGCWKDKRNPRSFGERIYHVNSKEDCAKVCRFNCWMAIQGNDGNEASKNKECRCSDNPTWGTNDPKACKSKCKSGTGTCGYSYTDSVYVNTALKNAPHCKRQSLLAPTSFVYIGCYEQKHRASTDSARNFNKKFLSKKMIFQCFEECKHYCFVAVQWLRYCTCGDKPVQSGQYTMVKRPDTECKRKQSALGQDENWDDDVNRQGTCNKYGCGGAWRDSVYVNMERVKAGKCKSDLLPSLKVSDFVESHFESFEE